MSMSCYVLLNKRLVFFFSFKSGNTSLAYWIYEYLKSRDNFEVDSKHVRSYLNNPNIHISAESGLSLIRQNGFKGVVLSRNPYTRAVSAFTNKFVVDGGRWIKTVDNLEHFSKSFLGQDAQSGVSFVEFLQKIKNSINSGTGLNRHFAPQVSSKMIGKKFFSYQVRLESVDDDLKKICESEKMEWHEFPKMRTTNLKLRSISDDLSSANCFELAKKEILPKSENLLNKNTINIINDIYKNDFIELNYEVK